jgi:predicted heme/steroid binding protein
MDVHDMAGTVEMAWWPKRRPGRHTAGPDGGHPITQAMERAAQDLRESIKERPKIDKLAELVRQEFGVRS